MSYGNAKSGRAQSSVMLVRVGLLIAAFLLLAAVIGTSLALADGAGTTEGAIPAGAELEAAANSPVVVEPTLTDPEAAEALPHNNLGREEAGELLEGVFEPEVRGPAGIFGDLQVEKFLAPNVAVIAAGERPEVAGEGPLNAVQGQEATLMDSTQPLATETGSGALEAINLNLESGGAGSLAPVNPLLDVAIPGELSEGIGLPGPGIEIEPEAVATSRAPSTLDGSVAFYPNVSAETDMAVAPTLGGVETLTQLRSPESPRVETYRLHLPSGAALVKEGAGAIVARGEETLMTVSPPTALDAKGNPVGAAMAVEGNDLVVEVTPTPSTAYPVLVDPLFQSFEWMAKRYTEYYNPYQGEGWKLELPRTMWAGGQAGSEISTDYRMDALVPFGSTGLDIWHSGSMTAGEEGYWVYRVPRYESDLKLRQAPPETFISRMTTSDVAWRAEGGEVNPYLMMGLWGPSKGWASVYQHEGNTGHSLSDLGFVYPFPNELSVPDVQEAKVGMWAAVAAKYAKDELFVGAATIELSEPTNSVPEFEELWPPEVWVNTGSAHLSFLAKDRGLGLHAFTVSSEGAGSHTWRGVETCTGVSGNPCPYSRRGNLSVEPELLPTGFDRLSVTAEDPIGHISAVDHVVLAVDHALPEVSISGSITEQATLGAKRPSYTVNVRDADGTGAHPQSGVAKVFIEVDGSVVEKSEPGCPLENCSVPLEATIESQKYAAGEHTLKVRVIDAAGNTATVERKFSLVPSPPTLTLAGSMTEQASLGTARPEYRLRVDAGAQAGIATAPPAPTFASSFGSEGTGAGQFKRPGGIVRDAKGDLWVVDYTDNRVEEFGPNGGYLSQFGSLGTGPGQMKSPNAIAIGSEGNLLVSDSLNQRIDRFTPQGQFVSSFGSSGTGNGQFGLPRGIAVDAQGDVWVSDSQDHRLQEFSPAGAWLKTVAGTGVKGAGQLVFPVGVAVGPEGNLWVVDLEADEVDEFEPSGAFVRSFGGVGTGPGKFSEPAGIGVDPHGDIWIADTGNSRVEEFDSEGRYLTQFSGGPGAGEFTLSVISGIAFGPTGTVWIADNLHKRVGRWTPADAGSEVVSEVQLDGRPMDYASRSCAGEHCSVSDEWTLESSTITPGKHEVAVTVSDGLGNGVTRILPIEIQRDNTAPGLEVGGELANAPEGWVQQETYGVHAATIDGGYGVTSLVLKIDGQTVAHEERGCPDGGCGLSLLSQVDMAPYSGGAHKAEIIATDGAGNRNVKSWTINVDPEGRITTQEETETLEAVEATSELTPVAPTDQLLELEQREGGDNPGLKVSGSEITSTGVPDVTTMTTNAGEGFSIKSPEGATSITPVVSETSSKTSVENGVAGVTSNVAKEVDSVIRPEYNGVQLAQAIRSEASPESFSWRVHLGLRQELVQENPTQAEVRYIDGTEAFLITAEPAHDATGKPVPTSLAVNGDELTVKVEFRGGGFVFPIVAGEGWETSYTVPVMVEGPEDETQIREREERELIEQLEREREEREAEENGGSPPPPPPPSQVTETMARRYAEFGPERDPDVAPPPLPPPGAATASDVRYFQIYRSSCGHSCDWWKAKLYNATFIRHTESAEWEHGTQVHAHVDQSLLFEAVIFDTTWNCGAVGPGFVRKGSGEHLIAFAHFTIEVPWAAPAGETMAPFENNFALQDWIYPNGYQEKHVKPWDGEPNGDLACPTVARP